MRFAEVDVLPDQHCVDLLRRQMGLQPGIRRSISSFGVEGAGGTLTTVGRRGKGSF